MWATLYTDASWKDGHGGGWAVWARSPHGRIVRAGPCPKYVRTSLDAELAAIYAGLYLIARSWPRVTAVLVRSDCQGALALAEGTQRPRSPAVKRLRRRLDELFAERPLQLSVRWVRGHAKQSEGTPTWLNKRCDALARTARTARGDAKRPRRA